MPSPSEAAASRPWELYLQDMQVFAARAVQYCQGKGITAFLEDHLLQDAVIRNIELIGEAATRVPDHVREGKPEIPWRQIIAMRNQLIHAYLGVDLEIVWDVVQSELPELLRQLAAD